MTADLRRAMDLYDDSMGYDRDDTDHAKQEEAEGIIGAASAEMDALRKLMEAAQWAAGDNMCPWCRWSGLHEPNCEAAMVMGWKVYVASALTHQ